METQNFLGISRNSLFRLLDDPKEAEKAYESLRHYKENNIKDAYDFFNKLTKGNGSRTYNRFTADKIEHSLEYVNTFDYIKHKKTFNLDTKEGQELHVYRNKNQYHKAPKDLKSAKKFIDAGYFIFEGFSPCHNLTKEKNTYEGRKATLVQTIWLLNHKLLYRPNQYSACHNISIRGTPGSSFEGCQFIYNYDTGKLVTDNINRGTWDYGKYATHMHYILDIIPWLNIGNGDNIENPEMFLMTPAQEKLYLNSSAVEKLNEVKKQSSIFMSDKTVKDEYEKFIKWSNDTKGMIIVHSNEEKDLIEKQLKQAKEDFIENQYQINAEKKYCDNTTSNLDMAYTDSWFDYVSFLTCVENREITNGLDNLINYIDTNPPSLKTMVSDDVEREKYNKLIFKSNFANGMDQSSKYKGNTIPTTLPITIDVHFSENVKTAILDVKNKLGDTEARNQAIFYVNAVTTTLNKKIAKYNFGVRFDGDFEHFDLILDHFLLSVVQFRRVSETESTILDNKLINKSAEKFLANYDEITEFRKSSEGLVIPAEPEYSEEMFGLGKQASFILGAFLVTLLIGTAKIAYDKFTKDRLDKIAKTISKNLTKSLSDEYDRLYKTNVTIKKRISDSKIAYAFAEYDKYGEYNLYEPSDFMKKEDYIEYRATMILSRAKEAKSYDDFVELSQNDKHDTLLLDGFMLKEVFEDTGLLDELVKFEYGDNNTDQYSRIDYLQTNIRQMEDKISDYVSTCVKMDPEAEFYFLTDMNAVNWQRVGKEPIKNQLKFKVGYKQLYKFDYESIRKDIETLISKL